MRRRRARFAAVAVGLGLLAAVLLLELLVRVAAPQSDFFGRPDDVVGFLGQPGKTGWSHGPEFHARVEINSHGFRDRERALEKAPGARRLVVLGDSFTEALQVDREQTFEALLEGALGGTTEVLAMGISGFGTAQEALIYEHHARPFRPDEVLLAFCCDNDPTDNHPVWRGHAFLPGFRPGPGPDDVVPVEWHPQPGTRGLVASVVRSNRLQLLSWLAHWWLRRLALARAEGHDARGTAPTPPPAPDPTPPPTPARGPDTTPPPAPVAPSPPPVAAASVEDEAWELTRRLLLRLRDDVRADGARLRVALIPRKQVVEGTLPPTEEERAARVCAGLGLETIDLLPALRSWPDQPVFLAQDGHFTPAGHAAVAAELARRYGPPR